MKRIIAVVAVLVLTLMSSLSAVAQVVTPGKEMVDSEQAAQAFLQFERTIEYRGQFNWTRDDVWQSGSYTMNADGYITGLNINDTDIPIPADKPLRGLPLAKEPMSNFNIWAYAYDIKGNMKAHGFYSTELLTANSVIKLVMRPGQVRRSVAFVPPLGIDQSFLRLKLDNGNTFAYDSYRDCFEVWLDPMDAGNEYEIYRIDTGDVLSIGKIGPSSPPVENGQKAVNMTLVGNVVEAFFPIYTNGDNLQLGDYVWAQDLKYDGWVNTKGGMIPAKVFITDLNGFGGLDIFTDDPDANIIVSEYVEGSPSTMLETQLISQTLFGKGVRTVKRDLGKVSVKIMSPNTERLFNIQFRRYTGLGEKG